MKKGFIFSIVFCFFFFWINCRTYCLVILKSCSKRFVTIRVWANLKNLYINFCESIIKILSQSDKIIGILHKKEDMVFFYRIRNCSVRRKKFNIINWKLINWPSMDTILYVLDYNIYFMYKYFQFLFKETKIKTGNFFIKSCKPSMMT